MFPEDLKYTSEHEWLLGYRWDIVLTGTHATPMEEGEHA